MKYVVVPRLPNYEEPTTYLPQTFKFQVNAYELQTDAEIWNDKHFI